MRIFYWSSPSMPSSSGSWWCRQWWQGWQGYWQGQQQGRYFCYFWWSHQDCHCGGWQGRMCCQWPGRYLCPDDLYSVGIFLARSQVWCCSRTHTRSSLILDLPGHPVNLLLFALSVIFSASYVLNSALPPLPSTTQNQVVQLQWRYWSILTQQQQTTLGCRNWFCVQQIGGGCGLQITC